MQTLEVPKYWAIFYIIVGAVSIGYVVITGGLLWLLLIAKNEKQNLLKILPFFLIFDLFALLVAVVVINFYYSQFYSEFNDRGVTWPTLLDRKELKWKDVKQLRLVREKGGQRTLIIASSDTNFRIEEQTLKNPDEVIKFAETMSHLRATEG